MRPFPKLSKDESPDQRLARAYARFNWLRGLDLTQRPLGYEPKELPDCSTLRSETSSAKRRVPNSLAGKGHPAGDVPG